MTIGRKDKLQARIAAALLALPLFLSGSAQGRGGWPDPPGGWTYVYEALPGEALYAPGDDVVGLLDGTWAQHSASSQWDGSAPGEIDTTTIGGDGMLCGASPGGARIRSVPGAGEDGGDASVLSIEDTGDPTVADGLGRVWSDPSNRKLYFWHEASGSDDIGWTLFARFRLTPDPIDVDVSPKGFRGLDVQSDGKGQLSIVEQGGGGFGMSLGEDGNLQIGSTKETIPIADPTQFHSVWACLRELEGASAYRVRVFIDGRMDPVFDGVVPAGTGTEAGAPQCYIAMGLHRTSAAGALEIDAFGFRDAPFDPGVTTECPSDFACTVGGTADAPEVILRWTNPLPYEGFDILRDGVLLEGGIDGLADLYIDEQPIAGTHRYELIARGAGGPCALSACDVSLCPADLRFEILYPDGQPVVLLSWTTVSGLESIEVLRDGVVLAQGLDGDVTSFLDDEPPALRTIVRYEVVGHGPDGATCTAVDYEDVLIMAPERPWAAPPGGWDWSYDAEGHDPASNPLDRYVPEFSVPGNLDGAWIRSADSDRWDGSEPGEWGPAPDGPAPGGVRIDRLDEAGPCGETIEVLRIEDPGDPHGYGEIDNRKIFLGRDTGVTDRNLLATGVTLCVRWRMAPDPVDLAEVRPDGTLPYKEHGQVGIFFRNTGAP
ncbi:MAG: hypothetical protein JXP34_18110, partial [Planctomycetes bacterium]|nr:hypothetical protein [Planctomycetota bacterium]